MIGKVYSQKTWAITTFFNPISYKNKRKNYRIFRKNLKRQGIKLLAVECAFRDKKFELKKRDADILIKVKSYSILWQKERLLNIALKKLPKTCENVVWIDADIIFINNDWIQNVEKLLERYSIIQPFSESLRLEKKDSFKKIKREISHNTKKRESFAYFLDKNKTIDINFNTEGGFAWAGKKDILEKNGFYDKKILGGGDWIANGAFFGINTGNEFSADWVRDVYYQVKGNVSYLEGTIIHLYHGSFENRQYANRDQILSKNNYNPENDLKLNNDECWEWSTNNASLQKEVEEYFASRKEYVSLLWNLFHKIIYTINKNICIKIISLLLTIIFIKIL